MIKDRERKIGEIIGIITSGCLQQDIDLNDYGPSLYFYRQIMEKRRTCTSVSDFLSEKSNIELLYATLVSWKMDTRGAKMLYFDDFKEYLLSCSNHFQFLENYQVNNNDDWDEYLTMIRETYDYLWVMKTGSRFVSNSKTLHFLLPDQFVPMDKRYTLKYLYNNNHESSNRYIEIFEFMYEIIEILKEIHAERYLDDLRNQTIPKLIDNAIMQIRKD